jgi:hypothetical protein
MDMEEEEAVVLEQQEEMLQEIMVVLGELVLHMISFQKGMMFITQVVVEEVHISLQVQEEMVVVERVELILHILLLLVHQIQVEVEEEALVEQGQRM